MTNVKKKQKLRNNEYYNLQETFDQLYAKSKRNYIFTKLMDLITSRENIQLAYRNLKKNDGSYTAGVDGKNIEYLQTWEMDKLIFHIQRKFNNYSPQPVRRVEIPKPNGKTRPLGIPTIMDRIIQQCILQVLEPICEAKFHKKSNGFRPNKSTENAIAQMETLMQLSNHHIVVDIDIKGFFDNVNHSKLLKQIWTLGIRDKKLICIISAMLKAEIKGVGIPEKGTPQGGILSPLLSNIVLNELDWWIASQWDTFPSRKRYLSRPNYKGNGTLKKIYIVRYADDFKIFCKTRSEADKVFIAVKRWLKERLMLDISPEKSKVVNLKKNYSNFLGFKLKLRKKSGKWILKSHMADKAKDNCKSKIREAIAQIRKEPNQWSVMRFNATILGLHNYFKIATNVYVDFDRIAFDVRKTLLCRTKTHRTKTGSKSKAFQNFYGEFTGKVFYVEKMALYPVNGVKTSPPMCFTQSICNYTQEGRRKIHEMQKSVSPQILQYLMGNPIKGRSVELNDNRISMYVAQRGKCAITHEPLETKDMEVHHITPIELGGKDNYENLVLVTYTVHKLIHATTPEAIEKYKEMLNNVDVNWTRLNKLRLLAGNCKI